jgi:L-aspartate oxidase
MWEKAGIIRCASSLAGAKAQLQDWHEILSKDYASREELELKNMLTVSGIIVQAADARKGSVGAHYRSDYKERGNRWKEHLTWDKNSMVMEKRPLQPQGKGPCAG